MLVSWSPCLVQTTTGTTAVCNSSNTTGANVTQAPPQYTLWIYDFDAGTLSPLLRRRAGHEVVEPVILQARTPRRPTSRISVPTTAAQETMATTAVGHSEYQQRVRLRRRRYGEAEHRHPGEPGQASFYARPARFIESKRRSKFPARRCASSIVRFRARRHGHARNPGLCADPARWLGPDSGAGGGAVHHRRPRLECPAHHGAAHQLAAALPGETKSCNGCHTGGNRRPLARAGGLTRGQPGRADHRCSPFPSTNRACSPMPARPWRKPWRASAARRQRAPDLLADCLSLGCGLRADLDHRHDAAGGRADRTATSSLPLCGPPASRAPSHQRELRTVERAVPHHHPLRRTPASNPAQLTSKILEPTSRASPPSTASPIPR